MNSEVIRLEGLKKHYHNGFNVVKALDGVDLSISKGEFIAIVGKSGSGKTTLLSAIGLLLKPTSGKVYLDGVDASSLSTRKQASLRARIGNVWQQLDLGWLPELNARENVEYALALNGIKKRNRKEIALESLRKVKIEDRADHKPQTLSGGEMQRLVIAKAIAIKPKIILADEATGNLDTETGNEIMDLFYQLHDGGETILFVTHDEDIAERINTVKKGSLIHMLDGKITGEGNAR